MHLHAHCQGMQQEGAALDRVPAALHRNHDRNYDDGPFEQHAQNPINGAVRSQRLDVRALCPYDELLDGEAEVSDRNEQGLVYPEASAVREKDLCNRQRHQGAVGLVVVEEEDAKLVKDENPKDAHKPSHQSIGGKEGVWVEQRRTRLECLSRIKFELIQVEL